MQQISKVHRCGDLRRVLAGVTLLMAAACESSTRTALPTTGEGGGVSALSTSGAGGASSAGGATATGTNAASGAEANSGGGGGEAGSSAAGSTTDPSGDAGSPAGGAGDAEPGGSGNDGGSGGDGSSGSDTGGSDAGGSDTSGSGAAGQAATGGDGTTGSGGTSQVVATGLLVGTWFLQVTIVDDQRETVTFREDLTYTAVHSQPGDGGCTTHWTEVGTYEELADPTLLRIAPAPLETGVGTQTDCVDPADDGPGPVFSQSIFPGTLETADYEYSVTEDSFTFLEATFTRI